MRVWHMDENHCDTENLQPNTLDCLKRGHTMLFPGCYVCADGDTHYIAPEICRFVGVEPTQENCIRVAAIAQKYFRTIKLVK